MKDIAKELWLRVKRFILPKCLGYFMSALIVIMLFADFMNLYSLFQNLAMSDENALIMNLFGSEQWARIFSDATVFALIAALLLEGAPVFISNACGKLWDKTRHHNVGRGFSMTSLIVAFVCFVGAVAVVIWMRLLLMKATGSWQVWQYVKEQISLGEKITSDTNLTFIADLFLLPLPALTSLWAFAASIGTAKNRSIDDLKRDVEILRLKKIRTEKSYLKAESRKKDAKWVLWRQLAGKEKEMPESYDRFRYLCTQYIQEKYIADCIIQFSDQSKRFNSVAMCQINDYLEQLSKMSNMPESIKEISIEDLILQHDKGKESKDCWDFNKSYKAHEANLKKLLDNATVIAQFKVTDEPSFTDKRSNYEN